MICLFDIDGTLIETGGAGRAALETAFQAEFSVELSHRVDLRGRTDRGIGGELFERHGIEDSSANWRLLRDAYVALLPAMLRERRGRVLPGVVELVEQLAAAGVVDVGLLTGNVREGARIKLGHFDLERRISWFGGFGDELPCRNLVAAAALRSAAEHLGRGVSPDEIWIVGDTPRDIECARSIGARSAAVATGEYSPAELAEHRPDLLLETLGDAAELLAALGA